MFVCLFVSAAIATPALAGVGYFVCGFEQSEGYFTTWEGGRWIGGNWIPDHITGNVNGQGLYSNGDPTDLANYWAASPYSSWNSFDNGPIDGYVTTLPGGRTGQGMAITPVRAGWGIMSGIRTPAISNPAGGEAGKTTELGDAVTTNNCLTLSFWIYIAEDFGKVDGTNINNSTILQIMPESATGMRDGGQIRIAPIVGNADKVAFYASYGTHSIEMDKGQWYRIHFDAEYVENPGPMPEGTSNDLVRISLYDTNGNRVGETIRAGSWEDWYNGTLAYGYTSFRLYTDAGGTPAANATPWAYVDGMQFYTHNLAGGVNGQLVTDLTFTGATTKEDLKVVLANFGNPNAFIVTGDTNYDGVADASDYHNVLAVLMETSIQSAAANGLVGFLFDANTGELTITSDAGIDIFSIQIDGFAAGSNELPYYWKAAFVNDMAQWVSLDPEWFLLNGEKDLLLGTFAWTAFAEGAEFKVGAFVNGEFFVLTGSIDYTERIPEPVTMSLLALGGLALLRRRK